MVIGAGLTEGDRARNELLVRYHVAVYRYLQSRLSDPHAADDLFSLFAERVKENHPFLKRADRGRGRFRDYLRGVLQRMIVDYYRQQARDQRKVGPLPIEPLPDRAEGQDGEEQFNKVWAEELMNQAWRALEDTCRARGQAYFALLLYKGQNPGSRSEQIAAHFSKELGKPLTAANVRQLLHRGQELLSDLLVEEVARSLRQKLGAAASIDQVEEELIALGLLDTFRKKALERRRGT
jgi:RNA polymerase sigma-70 factor (ECF subfamily)